MLRLVLISSLLVWHCADILAQSASVHAISPTYSGKTIHTSIAWNPFITVYEFSASLVCSDEGEFEQLVPLSSPRVVQFETGIYQAYLYMEPGYHYELILPDYVERKWDQRISPFYEPVSLPLSISSRTSLSTGELLDGSQDVNRSIARFDSLFAIANREVLGNRRNGKNSSIDSLILQLEIPFEKDSSRFFSDYRRFRYGVLNLNEGKTSLATLSRDYLGPTVMEWHPGFIELFRAMFKDFIFYYSDSPEGTELKRLINRDQDYRKVRELILNHPAVWSDSLAEMILLKEFSELFYRGDYHKEAILIMLDSMAQNPIVPEFGVYAAQLKQKLSSLVIGHTPPDMSLEDLEGNLCSLDDFKGKYTFLFFGTTDHYGCMMEYPFLQSFMEKHAAYLNVITVMVSEERGKLKNFMQRNGYTWKVLHYEGQPDIMNDYMVRAYPTAYLIDRNGLLLLSPATLPSEGFEQQLFRIMRSRGEI